MKVTDFTYPLKDEQIAKYPINERDKSKLLVYNSSQQIGSDIFKNIEQYLPNNSLLVFNNTKVIHARLQFRKTTGANIEIFCLNPFLPEQYELILNQTEQCQWLCMVGNKRKWKDGELVMNITVDNIEVLLTATYIEQDQGAHKVEFQWNNKVPFYKILHRAGNIPIPPYLNRNSENIDKERYQTVFAHQSGSVAAPTASLHFTNEVIASLHKKGHKTTEVTLHVGAGTFQPLQGNKVEDHTMHSELISVDTETITDLTNHEGCIVASGTTAMRTLESLYWAGILLHKNGSLPSAIPQWVWKENKPVLSRKQSFAVISGFLEKHQQKSINFSTQLLIHPGYIFKVADVLITNFHQPGSTLLLLVSAFIGNNWKKVYDYALENNFRFLSYGDSSLLFKQDN